jgi:predicted  nucleic acid-binding Zn-ribbon protein
MFQETIRPQNESSEESDEEKPNIRELTRRINEWSKDEAYLNKRIAELEDRLRAENAPVKIDELRSYLRDNRENLSQIKDWKNQALKERQDLIKETLDSL